MMKKMNKYSSKTKVLRKESSRMRREKPKNQNLVREGEVKIYNLNDLYSILIVNSKKSNLIKTF
jgi:hypothetical protein